MEEQASRLPAGDEATPWGVADTVAQEVPPRPPGAEKVLLVNDQVNVSDRAAASAPKFCHTECDSIEITF